MMVAIPMTTIQEALDRIDELCGQLGGSTMDRMIVGTLKELKVHFLQRTIARSYCTDLDFIVYGFDDEKDKRVVIHAIVEVKKNNRPLGDNQQSVYTQIAKALKVPFYLLEADDVLSRFWITDMAKGEREGPIGVGELDCWFRSLSDPTVKFYTDDRADRRRMEAAKKLIMDTPLSELFF